MVSTLLKNGLNLSSCGQLGALRVCVGLINLLTKRALLMIQNSHVQHGFSDCKGKGM